MAYQCDCGRIWPLPSMIDPCPACKESVEAFERDDDGEDENDDQPIGNC